MKNNQSVSILNYNAIGESILKEVLSFSMDSYAFVDIETYSEDTILNMATEFVENHREEALDYIEWCLALISEYDEKTYDVISDIVKKYTIAENKEYYWDNYLRTFSPTKREEEEEKDIITKSKEFSGSSYVTPSSFNKLENEKSGDEYKVNEYLKKYGLVGRDVLEHEVINLEVEDSLYWINIDSLSAKTVEAIGKEFVESNPKEAEKLVKYVLGMEDDYPDIFNIVEGIIQKNILKFDKESYYWNSRFSQIMPREILLDMENYLSCYDISFIHKSDDGEYIEVPLKDNSSIKIHGLCYVDGQNSIYYIEADDDELHLDKDEILEYINKLNNSLSKRKNMYTLENITYINHEKNWLLQQTMVYADKQCNSLIHLSVKVFDISKDMAKISDDIVNKEILNDSAWAKKWNKVSSFTTEINKF